MRLYNRLDRWSLAGADKILAVCGPFAEQVLRAGVSPERVIVQHNAIDRPSPPTAAAIQQVRTRLGIAPNQRLLIAIGRLSSEKGHLDLIDAYAAFRTLKPAIASKLVLLGDGPERSNLEARIHSAQLSGHVVLAGHIQDVQPYYSASDLVIIPSHSEGSPYVLLEAMAAGVPVVATAVGGIPEIAVNERTALLVPPHNPSALAAAIARMIDNPELAQELSRNAQADVSSRFSPNVYVDEMLRVYSGLIARRAR
jgi:Glycosyltransferase